MWAGTSCDIASDVGAASCDIAGDVGGTSCDIGSGMQIYSAVLSFHRGGRARSISAPISPRLRSTSLAMREVAMLQLSLIHI